MTARFLVLATVLTIASLANADNSTVEFKKLVLLSRHGIRTPYPSTNLGQPTYSSFSRDNRPWPETPADWGSAGEEHLTSHGMLVLQRMGQFFRQWLPFDVQPEAATVYADEDTSQRDVQTAENFLLGLGFEAPKVYHNSSCTEMLFNQGAHAPTTGCGLPSQAMVDGTIGGGMEEFTAQYKDVIMDLNDAIGCCNASVCGSSDTSCSLMDIPSSFNPAAFWSLYSGALSTASTLAEFLALMYANNMTSSVAPGLSMYELSRIMEVHALDMRLTDSNLVTAKAFGSQLVDHISRTIAQLTTGVNDPSLLSQPSDRLVYYAAHDINLYFLRTFLRLQWQTESYNRNMAPPGSMLGFQLLQDSTDGAWYVKLFIATQSMDQMRSAQELTASSPPSIAPVLIPECYGGPELSCAVADFQKLVANVVRPECLVPLQC